jgi:genome maintenance exonuclease 1
MVFNHTPLIPYEQAQKPLLVSNNGYSHYEINGQKVTRITQILNSYENQGLVVWRQKMGEYAANLESKRGRERGNSVHKISEAYLKNDLRVGQYENELLPYGMFQALRPSLDRISDIRVIEAPVYHRGFNVAGTADIIANFDGVLSIIDLKTSKMPKRFEWCKKYFLQECFYSLAIEDMTKVPISTLIALEVSENGVVQVLKQDRDSWINELESIIADYNQIKTGVSI